MSTLLSRRKPPRSQTSNPSPSPDYPIEMPPIDMNNANPQLDSPLFNRIPGEIRDRIFEFAVTDHCFGRQPYAKNAYYYRPNYRYKDTKIDTTLLRTCRRIYQETWALPLQNFQMTLWYYRGPQVGLFPRGASGNRPNRDQPHVDVKSLHLFTQQFWLEKWENEARGFAKQLPNLQHLRITLRHSDWWWWENSSPLRLDPKQHGTADMRNRRGASDPFDGSSWGNQLQHFQALKTFELELETVEGKSVELDEIVKWAPGWKFPVANDRVLRLNPSKTRRTGWHGAKLRE